MEKYCTDCGFVGKTKRHMPGSILIELMLWCIFVIPGMIYSIWRHSSSKEACKECGGSNIIPTSSPKAKAALNKTSA